MFAFLDFLMTTLKVVFVGFTWLVFAISLISTVYGVWWALALIFKRNVQSMLAKQRKTMFSIELLGAFGPFAAGLFFSCLSGFMLWNMQRETISNWFLPSQGMFGKEIGGYEQNFLDGQYPPIRKDGKLVDCWEWRYQKEDGRYIVPIIVPKPLKYFSAYNLHLLPMSKRSFILSGYRFNATKEEYDKVKELLICKYGKPTDEKDGTCSFEDGKKKIGLVFTSIFGKPQLYINAYRTDLLDENLPNELKEFEEQRKEKVRKENEEYRQREIDSL